MLNFFVSKFLFQYQIIIYLSLPYSIVLYFLYQCFSWFFLKNYTSSNFLVWENLLVNALDFDSR